MKYKIAYAIVSKSKIKHFRKIVFTTVDERLPIFWNKKVASDFLFERYLDQKSQVLKIYIPIDYP